MARGGWTESFSVFVGLYHHAPKRRLLFRVGAKPSAPAFGVFTAICIPELVVGIDICPHIWPDEAQTPPNLNLQVDDLNGRFTFPSNHFDLVHSQMMAGGIHSNRWRDYLRDIHRVLRPGGWVQTVEIYFNAQSDNGTLTQNHALRRWSRRYLDSMQPYKDPRAPLQMQSWMQSAGFDSVETQMIPLPTCGWSNETQDPRQHQIGLANRENVRRFLSSLGHYPMTEFRGMTSQEFQVLVAQARSEADNPEFRAYFPMYVCIGRKRR
ncbi:Secondary metabolism regulator LAE1 [Colletotrichum fructicola]|nr:Secondary metabolism regulator LAE1 [Colletotrichum fructicola]KAF4903935.1 Secondary metabolism regulator LAE1 [Colletotrichum fructicola]